MSRSLTSILALRVAYARVGVLATLAIFTLVPFAVFEAHGRGESTARSDAISDFNGDGISDYLVSIQAAGVPDGRRGSVQVYSGVNDEMLFELVGDNVVNDLFGFYTCAIDDLNGDGCDEIVVGLPGVNPADVEGDLAAEGRVVIYSGQTAQPLMTVNEPTGGIMGRAVTDLGDQNNDGHSDLAVAWVLESFSGDLYGAVSVYSGADGSELRTIIGEAPEDGFGFQLAAVEDVSGDGVAELAVVSTQQETGASTAPGKLYVFESGSVGLGDAGDAEHVLTNPGLGTTTFGWKLDTQHSSGLVDVVSMRWDEQEGLVYEIATVESDFSLSYSEGYAIRYRSPIAEELSYLLPQGAVPLKSWMPTQEDEFSIRAYIPEFLSEPAREDLNGDGEVDGTDLALLLDRFGAEAGASFRSGDLDGDGVITSADLAGMLSAFGPVESGARDGFPSDRGLIGETLPDCDDGLGSIDIDDLEGRCDPGDSGNNGDGSGSGNGDGNGSGGGGDGGSGDDDDGSGGGGFDSGNNGGGGGGCSSSVTLNRAYATSSGQDLCGEYSGHAWYGHRFFTRLGAKSLLVPYADECIGLHTIAATGTGAAQYAQVSQDAGSLSVIESTLSDQVGRRWYNLTFTPTTSIATIQVSNGSCAQITSSIRRVGGVPKFSLPDGSGTEDDPYVVSRQGAYTFRVEEITGHLGFAEAGTFAWRLGGVNGLWYKAGTDNLHASRVTSRGEPLEETTPQVMMVGSEEYHSVPNSYVNTTLPGGMDFLWVPTGSERADEEEFYLHTRFQHAYDSYDEFDNPILKYRRHNVRGSVYFKVEGIDLDIDSDNSGDERSDVGNPLEDIAEDAAGMKLIPVNRGDADEDGIPGYADGYGGFGLDSDLDDERSSLFAEMHLKLGYLPELLEREGATVKILYSASDPSSVSVVEHPLDDLGLDPVVEYERPDGHLRIWKRRSGRTLDDFVPSGEQIPLAELSTSGTDYLYVEAVRGSATPTEIMVKYQVPGRAEETDSVLVLPFDAVTGFEGGDITGFTISRGSTNGTDGRDLVFDTESDDFIETGDGDDIIVINEGGVDTVDPGLGHNYIYSLRGNADIDLTFSGGIARGGSDTDLLSASDGPFTTEQVIKAYDLFYGRNDPWMLTYEEIGGRVEAVRGDGVLFSKSDWDWHRVWRDGSPARQFVIQVQFNLESPLVAASHVQEQLMDLIGSSPEYRIAFQGRGYVDAVSNEHSDEEEIRSYIELRNQQVEDAASVTALVASLYLSGVSILSEGADLVIAVGDVLDGDYAAALAALPFISAPSYDIGSRALLRVLNEGGAAFGRAGRVISSPSPAAHGLGFIVRPRFVSTTLCIMGEVGRQC